MEWAVHNVPASRCCNYPLFRYGPVGGRGATIRRLMDVFLLEPVSRHFTYIPVRTKSLDSCMGYRLLLRKLKRLLRGYKTPFSHLSLYRSDCLRISAHVCTEMHMNICVYVCVYLCVHIYISPCMYVYVLQAFLSFYSSL